MGQRTDLQQYLEFLLGSDQVHFQPPESLKMSYPAIVYSRDRIDTEFADNAPYEHRKRYTVTVIYREPDSDLPMKIASMPLSSHTRFYTADLLYHDSFSLYF